MTTSTAFFVVRAPADLLADSVQPSLGEKDDCENQSRSSQVG